MKEQNVLTGWGPGQPDLEGGILAHGRASELKGLF